MSQDQKAFKFNLLGIVTTLHKKRMGMPEGFILEKVFDQYCVKKANL